MDSLDLVDLICGQLGDQLSENKGIPGESGASGGPHARIGTSHLLETVSEIDPTVSQPVHVILDDVLLTWNNTGGLLTV